MDKHLRHLRTGLDRVEDEIGRTIADLSEAVETLALEYTAHGEVLLSEIHKVRVSLSVLDEQGAMLARAAELRELADRLVFAAHHRPPMESDVVRVERFVWTQSSVGAELETTMELLQRETGE
ncbi:hypothetical protein [Kitasatospora sp. NPDC092286]|uniref:hypothetical protein n=1 Tax=Kitasatospora sp. NPDC092286 TaxID=3364087 RepID=UPI00381AEF5A